MMQKDFLGVACMLGMQSRPNRAFSGRGFAARERRRKIRAEVMRQRWGKDGDAAPLTLSLGDRLYFSKPEWRRHGYYLALCAF